MKKIKTILALTTLCIFSTASAKTSDSLLTGLQIGVNAVYSDSGYKTYNNKLAIVPTIFYDNGSIYARGNQLGYNLIKDDSNELSVLVQYDGKNYNPDNASGAFLGLNDRDASVLAGASYLYKSPYGAVRAQAMTDVSGKSEGKLAKVEYIARVTNKALTIYPSVGVQWQNDDYNQYYYGISSSESAKTGINQYSADSSIHPYANLRANYEINDKVNIFLNQKIAYNPNEVADSPMVDSKTSLSTVAGVLYQF